MLLETIQLFKLRMCQ